MTQRPSVNSVGWRAARALALLRPTGRLLLTSQAVVLETQGRARAGVRACPTSSASLEDQFSGAVALALQMMDDDGLQGRRWRVVVSDSWARPLLVPFTGALPSEAEVDVMLQGQFARLYGDLMNGWRWCWARQGEQLIAVAWPGAGLEALRAGIAQRAGRLTSAKPLALDVAATAPAASASGWLAILEQRSVTLVRREDGVWQEWRVMPTDADLASTLVLQLERESARRSDPSRRLSLIDLNATVQPQRLRQALADAGWQVEFRGTNSTDTSQASRLAHALNQGVSA